MVRYCNLRSSDLLKLTEYVNNSIAEGYEPVGSVIVAVRRRFFFFASHMYIQTMVKKQ